jgi:hypothetical protein
MYEYPMDDSTLTEIIETEIELDNTYYKDLFRQPLTDILVALMLINDIFCWLQDSRISESR